jgi:hypothetical protein
MALALLEVATGEWPADEEAAVADALREMGKARVGHGTM